MNKLILECSSCHHMILPNPGKIPVLVEILGGAKLYKCKNCNTTMDFYTIHVCCRDLTDRCNDCRFRFLCYTNDATKKA